MILPPLKYLSGAPYPPLLDPNYQPIVVERKESEVKSEQKSDIKEKKADDWSEVDPTYTFIAKASEQQFQTAVPQDLASLKTGADDQPVIVRSNDWKGIPGQTYKSYTFPCKGKSDDLYADIGLNCEVRERTGRWITSTDFLI